jgi:hypothetical protein
METKEQCYSVDNERYSGYEDMMDDLRESYNEGEEVEVWEAEKKEHQHNDFIDVDDLIYRMQENVVDCCGEVGEEYLNELTEEQKEDLKNHIADWFSANAKINFYGVENEHKILVVVE